MCVVCLFLTCVCLFSPGVCVCFRVFIPGVCVSQAVQEEGSGGFDRTLRLQGLRLPDGDDHPCPAARLLHWRGQQIISLISYQ